jgi:hypothetical protein
MPNLDLQTLRQAVLSGNVRSVLTESTAEIPVTYAAVGLAAEHLQCLNGQDLVELVRTLSRRSDERHAVILAVVAVASIAAADPHARIKQLSAAAYIENEILPHLLLVRSAEYNLEPFISELCRELGIKGAF